MSSIVIQEITDAAALAALEAEWWDLWNRCPNATPFQSPAWLLSWWRHFAPGALRTLAARQNKKLVGLALFYLEDGALGLRLLPLGISLSDQLDILIDPPTSASVGAAIADHVSRWTDWRRWELEELGEGASALSLPCPAGATEDAGPQSACPVLRIAGKVDGLPGGIPADRRRKLRRARRLAEEKGGFAVERVRTDPDAFLDHLFRLHGARWESRGENGVLTDDSVQSFQREAMPRLLQAGIARLYTVRISGRVAGVYYGFLHRSRAYAYLGGFDPDFAYESPGAILMGHAIAEAAREGAHSFDFLRGREAYKYQWGAEDRWNRRRSFQRTVA